METIGKVFAWALLLVIVGGLAISTIVYAAYIVRNMVNAHEKYCSDGHPILATIWLIFGLSLVAFGLWHLTHQEETRAYGEKHPLIFWLGGAAVVAIPLCLLSFGAWLDRRKHRRKEKNPRG